MCFQNLKLFPEILTHLFKLVLVVQGSEDFKKHRNISELVQIVLVKKGIVL